MTWIPRHRDDLRQLALGFTSTVLLWTAALALAH
jgi:hypothetical protein